MCPDVASRMGGTTLCDTESEGWLQADAFSMSWWPEVCVRVMDCLESWKARDQEMLNSTSGASEEKQVGL